MSRERDAAGAPREAIFSLLYVSLLNPVSAAVMPTTLRDILVASVANNRRDQITGFLVCDGYYFIQILEGPEVKVQSCFSRICEDERNIAPTVRKAEFSPARAFPRWSMCGLTLSPSDNALLRRPDIDFDPLHASPGAVMQQLRGLALRHGLELDDLHAELLTRPR